MIVYDGFKSDFLHSVEGDTIALEIEQNILAKMGKHTVANEFLSWDNSMQYMYKVMNDPEIPSEAASKGPDIRIGFHDRYSIDKQWYGPWLVSNHDIREELRQRGRTI